MKLYQGTVHVNVMVAAEDEEDAIDLVQQHAEDETVHCLHKFTIKEIRKCEDIPHEWRDRLVYPYGDDEMVPGDLLEGGEEK